eukprot:1799984-Ditylum_brightwellii.AAC.1
MMTTYIFLEEVYIGSGCFAKVLQVSVLMRTEVDKFLRVSLVVVAKILGLVSQQQADGLFLGKASAEGIRTKQQEVSFSPTDAQPPYCGSGAFH